MPGTKGQAKAEGFYLEGEDVLGDLFALQHFTGLQLQLIHGGLTSPTGGLIRADHHSPHL